MCDLVRCLITASEKAANIARVCREDETLFSLLIQEKAEAEANPRFVQDFKTLADVLIQETVRHDVKLKFPHLSQNIYGEECNTFCNTLGESISVEIKETEEETAKLLRYVLDGNSLAAKLLAAEVHKDVSLENLNISCQDVDLDLLDKTIGIWIDPIDSTAEYIRGSSNTSENEIALSGLECVTVLIGAFDMDCGSPIIGVINQPFYEGSKGRCFWGVHNIYNDTVYNNITSVQNEDSGNKIGISSSEDGNLKEALQKCGYELVEAAGAGYKLLLVILGKVDAYILSKPSTFKWDTCGPHAILKSLEGNIIDYSISENSLRKEVSYKESAATKLDIWKLRKYCNNNGIIAHRNNIVINNISQVLSEASA